MAYMPATTKGQTKLPMIPVKNRTSPTKPRTQPTMFFVLYREMNTRRRRRSAGVGWPLLVTTDLLEHQAHGHGPRIERLAPGAARHLVQGRGTGLSEDDRKRVHVLQLRRERLEKVDETVLLVARVVFAVV